MQPYNSNSGQGKEKVGDKEATGWVVKTFKGLLVGLTDNTIPT